MSSDTEQPNGIEYVKGSKAEMEYYRVVRMTLHGLDGVRLNASVSGLTVCSAFIGVAFTSWKYAGVATISGHTFSMAFLLSAFSCLISAITAAQFVSKISMFSHFIAKSVDIAHDFENKMVANESHKITRQFDHHSLAGPRGDLLFKISLYALLALAIIGCIASTVGFFASINLKS